ncbi:hypothetical protein ABK040_005742 [Willaertia magna]
MSDIVEKIIQQNLDIPTGGIYATIILNSCIVISFLILSLLCCNCHYSILLNKKKKKLLLEKYKERWGRIYQDLQFSDSDQLSSRESLQSVTTDIEHSIDSFNSIEDTLTYRHPINNNEKHFIDIFINYLKRIFYFFLDTTLLLFCCRITGMRRKTYSGSMYYKSITQIYGRQTATYLLFLQCVVYFVGIVTVLTCGILLPVNVTSKTARKVLVQWIEGNTTGPLKNYTEVIANASFIEFPLRYFSISMREGQPDWLWAHVGVSVSFLILTILFVYIFSVVTDKRSLRNVNEDQEFKEEEQDGISLISPYTLFIRGIPRHFIQQEKFKELCEYLFDKENIVMSKLIYNVRERTQLTKYLMNAENNLQYFENISKIKFRGKKLDEYLDFEPRINLFENQVKLFRNQIDSFDRCYTSVVNGNYLPLQQIDNLTFSNFKINCSGYGFIIFKNTKIVNDNNEKQFTIHLNSDMNSDLITDNNSEIKIHTSRARMEPSDTDWKVFSSKYFRKFKRLFNSVWIFIFLFIFFILFSTPTALVSVAQTLINIGILQIDPNGKKSEVRKDFIYKYLPTFVLFITSLIIPKIFKFLTHSEPHSSKSATERILTKRIYIYLILSTLILPSLWISSITGSFTYIARKGASYLFGRLYVDSTASFFVNYVLHLLFLKNLNDYLLVKDFVTYYVVNKFRPLSCLEKFKSSLLSGITISTEFGSILSALTILMFYSIYSPVIMIFGFLFFIVKFYIDHYLIELKQRIDTPPPSNIASDELSHIRQVSLLSCLMVVNCIILYIGLLAYFANESSDEIRLLPHCIVSGVMLILSFVVLGMVYYYFEYKVIRGGLLGIDTPLNVDKLKDVTIWENEKLEEKREIYMQSVKNQ